MSHQGPTLHSFNTAPETAPMGTFVAADANATIEEQDIAMVGNDTHDSIAQERDETIEDDSETRTTDAAGTVDHEDGDDEDEGPTGTSTLPLSKIKKIFKADPEHISASEAAVFSTAIATELFIQYFTEQASLISRSEKRKKLQYKDFASAVSNIDQLFFLGDTVPKTYNLKSLVEQNKVRVSNDPNAKPLEKGQGVLNFGKKGKTAVKKAGDDEDLPESDDELDVGEVLPNSGVLEDQMESDNTDDEDSVQEVPVRKDKDHDIIMN